jgi:hypothetical protein
VTKPKFRYVLWGTRPVGCDQEMGYYSSENDCCVMDYVLAVYDEQDAAWAAAAALNEHKTDVLQAWVQAKPVNPTPMELQEIIAASSQEFTH